MILTAMPRDVWEVTVPEEPPTLTAQQKGLAINRNGKPFAFTKKAHAEEQRLWEIMIMKYGRAPREPLDGALLCDVVLTHQAPATMKGPWPQPKITGPDADNAVKMLLDVLQKNGIIKNDSRIFRLLIVKLYAESPSVKIKLSQLQEEMRDATKSR